MKKLHNKICKKCQQSKLGFDFYKMKASSDGLQPYCIKCTKERNAEYHKKNKDKIQKRVKEYRGRHPKIYDEYRFEWRKNNKQKVASIAALRRCRKAMATPAWLTNIHKAQIFWHYAAADMLTKTSGIAHHVDHIHPIKGKFFSGLHVPWNLRVIKGSDNIRRGNKPPNEEADMFWKDAAHVR